MNEMGPCATVFWAIFWKRYAELVADSIPADTFDPAPWLDCFPEDAQPYTIDGVFTLRNGEWPPR